MNGFEWSGVLRLQLLELGPYQPGPSLDELKQRLGLDDVAKLNWNEGLFGPLAREPDDEDLAVSACGRPDGVGGDDRLVAT
jgi:hypothetical protein